MGKSHTKPRTELHIIHHYMNRNSSDLRQSNSDIYNSNSEVNLQDYVNTFTDTNGQNIERLDDIKRNTPRKLSNKDKSYSQNTILGNSLKSKRSLSKNNRTYSQPIIEYTDSLYNSKENKLRRKHKTYSQHSISTSSSQGTSSSYYNKISQKRKSLSLASIAGLSKTSLAEEWDFDSNFFEDGSDSSIAKNSTIMEETSSIDTIPEDMYIRYQSVRDLSRLFSVENDLHNPSENKANVNECNTSSNSNESSDEDTNLRTCSNPLEKQTLKPLEYMEHFEVDPYGCVVYTNAWNNMMWREALRRSSEQASLEEMSTSSSLPTKMFGPPKIPKTPSRAINNMLESRCGKPFDNKPKFLVASVICAVFNVITMIYDQIHKDKLRPSHKMWMVSCGIVAVAAIVASTLVYNIIVHSAFALHALLFYGCVLVALVGVGLCVSGMVFFDKEASKEDFEKER